MILLDFRMVGSMHPARPIGFVFTCVHRGIRYRFGRRLAGSGFDPGTNLKTRVEPCRTTPGAALIVVRPSIPKPSSASIAGRCSAAPRNRVPCYLNAAASRNQPPRTSVGPAEGVAATLAGCRFPGGHQPAAGSAAGRLAASQLPVTTVPPLPLVRMADPIRRSAKGKCWTSLFDADYTGSYE